MEHIRVEMFGMHWLIGLSPRPRILTDFDTVRVQEMPIGKLLWSGAEWGRDYLTSMRFVSRGAAEQYLADNEQALQDCSGLLH